MPKRTPQKRKPQQKKPPEFNPLEALRRAFLVWVPDGAAGYTQATIEYLGLEKSTVKRILEGDYDVVKNSEIRLKRPE